MNKSDTANRREPDNRFTRRDIIQQALIAAGFVTLAGSSLVHSACAIQPDRSLAASESAFSAQEIEWLDEVAEIILPETSTPGAKAAAVGAFIALMVTDTYSPEQQTAFREGMNTLEAASVSTCGKPFLEADVKARQALLVRIDREAIDYHSTRPDDAPPHYFRMIKGLTLLGYFTSEVGYTQAMRYVETPGRFDPCVDYSPGERAWARHA